MRTGDVVRFGRIYIVIKESSIGKRKMQNMKRQKVEMDKTENSSMQNLKKQEYEMDKTVNHSFMQNCDELDMKKMYLKSE